MKLLRINGQELKLQISPTFLQNAACPAYLKFHYVDRIGDRFIRVAAERGKVAHAAIADLLQYCMAEKMPVQKLEDGMLREALEKHLPPYIASEAALIYSWLRLWRDNFKLPTNVHGVEEKVALDDDYEECDWKEASYRGIIDLQQVSGSHAIITDWKSQPHILSTTELNEHEQGTMYCFLAQKSYPHLKSFTFRIWYLRYGFYHETSRSEEDLEAFETALMIRERKIIEIDDWRPIPGKHCQYCDYIHLCPIAQDLSPANPEIITQDQAELAAQRVTVFEALIKDLKGKLKHYVNHNDEVVINQQGYRMGHRPMVTRTIDPKEAEDVMQQHDHQLWEIANVGIKKVDKLVKKEAKENPELAAALENLVKLKHSTKFTGYQPGSDDDEEVE